MNQLSACIYEASLRSTNAFPAPDKIIKLPPPPVQGPMVSCLMVTRGDVSRVAASIACFRSQIYADKELVIVCDAVTKPLTSLCARSGTNVRLVQVKGKRVLGALRNISIDQARGDYVCQWDDDDLYSPTRLQQGMNALLQTGTDAMFLRQVLLWSPGQKRLCLSHDRSWEASMIVRKSALTRYPEIARGEDTPVAEGLLRRSRVAILDDPTAFCYCIHASNTWDDAHFTAILNAATLTFDYEAALSEFSVILPFASHPAYQPVESAPPAGTDQTQKLSRILQGRARRRMLHHRLRRILPWN
ncbi:glycosyltransferase family 2 protein [Aestuariivirga litoralis]|uniref:glycosyltransferase family 2 protein n=1 Tax=Aestuariivirga litoralis TaxID=2650924 RepID=UPI0018C4C369|nr:glycosyltransferase family A protein [Aestuariivirga litoralis]MBG1231108.1 glycosyltransferase family 2 protein [Aestuariivirga litoralis]